MCVQYVNNPQITIIYSVYVLINIHAQNININMSEICHVYLRVTVKF